MILLRRNHLGLYRNYPLLVAFFLQSCIIGIIVGFAFEGLGTKPSPAGIQSMKGLSFQMLAVYLYASKCVRDFADKKVG